MKNRLNTILAIQGVERRSYAGGLGPVIERAGDCYTHAGFVVGFPSRCVDTGFLAQIMTITGHTEIRLVHGFPMRQADKISASINDGIPARCRYGHAWVELRGSHAYDDLVYDAVSMILMDAADYYRVGEIEPEHCFAYEQSEVHRRIVETETVGPWEEYAGEGRVYWIDKDLPTTSPQCSQEAL